MSRAAASFAIILTLLTGLVLGQIGSLVRKPAEFHTMGSVPAPDALSTARAFYDGMNALLERGDRDIETTIAPGFVDHARDDPADRTMPEMIDTLLATRATWPHMRVTVGALDQWDSTIVAQLTIEPGAPRSQGGIRLPAMETRTVTEFLRVDGAGIIERWNADLRLPQITYALQTSLAWDGPSLIMPAILQFELQPGDTVQIPLRGSAILRIETGTVLLDRAGNDLDGNWHPAIDPIDAGHGRVLESTDPVFARNFSSKPALFWVFTTHTGTVDGPPAEATVVPGTYAAQISAFIPLLRSDLPGDAQRISIAQITLPPGVRVTPYETGILEEIVVLDGAIDVTVTRGRVLPSIDGTATLPVDDQTTIAAGSGIGVKGATSLGYRVVGDRPATLLIVRLDAPR